MMNLKATLYLSPEARNAMDALPRTLSVSAVFRWVLLAIVTPEKEFIKMRDASPEGRAIRDYLRGKVDKLVK